LKQLFPLIFVLAHGAFAQAPPQQAPAPQRFSLSAGEADLRDVLRAFAKDANINLTFEPGLETKVRGLELREMTLEEILTQVLPAYGIAVSQVGRTMHVHRSDGGMRFYPVDFLALRRQGTKSFSVNASGQAMQGGGGNNQGGGMGAQGGGYGGGMQGGQGGQGGMGGQQGGGGGNNAAFQSSLQTGSTSDPWHELQTGLSLMVFGEALQPKEGSQQPQGQAGQVQAPTASSFSKDGRSLLIQPDAGLVAVSADPGIQRRVEAYLGEMRKRYRRQVLLEAKIVEVTLGKDDQMGTDWSSVLKRGNQAGGYGTDVTSSLTTGAPSNTQLAGEGLFSLVAQNLRVQATISALARDGKLQVLSNPRIATLNNQKAILRVVREEAYFLQNSQITPGGVSGNISSVTVTPMVVPVGIILDIHPQIGEDGVIMLAVNPSVSEVAEVRTFQTTGASASLPVVDRRDLDTVVKLRNGETLVLAGIIRTNDTTDDRGVPWFRKIPLLGYLFSRKTESRQKTELAIFITPTLIEESDQVDRERQRTETRLSEAAKDPTGLKVIQK
jgi:MSHA biogenesis protein MshL